MQHCGCACDQDDAGASDVDRCAPVDGFEPRNDLEARLADKRVTLPRSSPVSCTASARIAMASIGRYLPEPLSGRHGMARGTVATEWIRCATSRLSGRKPHGFVSQR
jgi:hypothetical protein